MRRHWLRHIRPGSGILRSVVCCSMLTRGIDPSSGSWFLSARSRFAPMLSREKSRATQSAGALDGASQNLS